MESESMEIIEVKSILDIPMKFIGIAKYPNGTQIWYLNGEKHRDNGPAVIYSNGTQYWYQNGKLHREDGPAIIRPDGMQEWFFNGELHREDGPAILYSDGTQAWYLNGVRVTPMEVFEKLPDEKKEKVLWDLNQWK